MIQHVISGEYTKLYSGFIALVVLAILILIVALIDLHFGIKKSKADNKFKTHSFGLRQSWNKIKEYWAYLFLAFVVDFLNVIWVYVKDVEAMPLISIFVTITVVYTEYKSIREKSDEKVRHALKDSSVETINYISNITTIATAVKNGDADKIAEIAKQIAEQTKNK